MLTRINGVYLVRNLSCEDLNELRNCALFLALFTVAYELGRPTNSRRYHGNITTTKDVFLVKSDVYAKFKCG